LLEEARTAYQSAEHDTLVVAYAPVTLEQAQENLMESERLWKKKKDPERVEHYAYLAKQQVRIAQETAKMNAAENQVKKAEVERQQVLLTARAQEAERAKQQAELAKQEAQQAQQQAEVKTREAEMARAEANAALDEARKLADRVSELEAKQTERGLVLTLGDVLFDVDKATLKSGSERTIGELATFLNEYKERNVMIEGFTDSTGPEDYNEDLSQRRAEAVMNALTQRGIDANRVRVRGYGEAFPVSSNGTSSGRQQNRRVEIIISDENGQIPERTTS
jgi:outer membrane protein OmpA-like peptidoglycan-associated protein